MVARFRVAAGLKNSPSTMMTVRAMLLFLGTTASSLRSSAENARDTHLFASRGVAELGLDDDRGSPALEKYATVTRASPGCLNLGRDEVAERRGHHREAL
jgi:hypothetical protein